jgi:PD-(D/E)XK nuclease superfamily
VSAWSYSALTQAELCPKRFAALRVFKTYREPEGEAMLYGQRTHKSLENRVRHNAPLPADLQHLEPTVAKLVALGDTKAEEKYALDRSFRLTDYFDKPSTMPERRVWLRIVIDLQVFLRDRPDLALLIDWKTGKEKEDLDQLKLFAAVMFALYPTLREVRTGYCWTSQNRIAPTPFRREEASRIWQEFMPRVIWLENMYQTNAWQARPSGICIRHCPVTECAFHGKGSH